MSQAEDEVAAGDLAALSESIVLQLQQWQQGAIDAPTNEADDLLAGVRRSPGGVTFVRRLLDAVAGSNDPFGAAFELRAAAQAAPGSLPVRDRIAVHAGSIASIALPWAMLPLAKKWLQERVSQLVLSVKLPEADEPLPRSMHAALPSGEVEASPLFALHGSAVLGGTGAERERDRARALLARPEITALAIDPLRLIPARSDWALDHAAQLGAHRLSELLAVAQEHGSLVILEPRSYRGVLLAAQICVRALSDETLNDARLGIQLPAELPDSAFIAEELVNLAVTRYAASGAPFELILAETAIAEQAKVDALLSGFAVPTFEHRAEAKAQLVRLAQAAFSAGEAVTTVVATEDPLVLATIVQLAAQLERAVLTQLRTGVAPALAGALNETKVAYRQRVPLVPTSEFAAAIPDLLQLAIEASDSDSALAQLAELLPGYAPSASGIGHEFDYGIDETGSFAARRDALLAAAAEAAPPVHRTQSRAREWRQDERNHTLLYRPPASNTQFDTGGLTAAVLGLGRDATGHIVVERNNAARRIPIISESGFAAEPDTDGSLTRNREWARQALHDAATVRTERSSGRDAETNVTPEATSAPDPAVAAAWRELRPADRGTRIGRLALGVASARDHLITLLAAERGAPFSVLDAEISGTIDAARYLSLLASGIGSVRGAVFNPEAHTLVVGDSNTGFAELAEATLGALAAGSAVEVVLSEQQLPAVSALLEEWQAAGLPAGLITVRPVQLGLLAETLEQLVSDTEFDRAIVLGSQLATHTIRRRRPELRLNGRVRVAGSYLIAASADEGEAVNAAVRSAFGGVAEHRQARVLVLVGGASRAAAIGQLLADAVADLRVGDSADPGEADPLSFDLGPLAAPPTEANLRALTELEEGESWLLEPSQLDEAGLLWRPGVRLVPRADAQFWADAVGMPVIGVIQAGNLNEAIRLQNRLGGGSVAGLHASGAGELASWLTHVRAASVTVGRPTSEGRIEHQPWGGWGEAGLGVHPLAGGPHRLVPLGSWTVREGTPSSTLHLRGLTPEVQVLIETAQATLDYHSFDRLRRAALADALSWRTVLGRVRDTIGLGVERNLIRHTPVDTHVRLADDGTLAELLRVLAAGLVAGSTLSVSSGIELPEAIASFLAQQGIPFVYEDDQHWLERIATAGSGPNAGALPERLRLIGGDRVRAAEWIAGQHRMTLWADPVTLAGPVELLVFLREQAITVAAHRYGFVSPPPGFEEWATELDRRATKNGVTRD